MTTNILKFINLILTFKWIRQSSPHICFLTTIWPSKRTRHNPIRKCLVTEKRLIEEGGKVILVDPTIIFSILFQLIPFNFARNKMLDPMGRKVPSFSLLSGPLLLLNQIKGISSPKKANLSLFFRPIFFLLLYLVLKY
jgi:hypothetical protein